MGVCIICDRAYQRREEDKLPYCQQHLRSFQRKQSEAAKVQAVQSWRHKVRLVLHWQGMVVGLYPGQDNPTTYYPRPISVQPTAVPQDLLVDLDTYCAGYTRDQVRAFKRAIRQAFSLS